MTTGPKKIENRGGTREGSGRKPKISLTQKQIKQMLATAREFTKQHGKSIDEILLGIIYDNHAIEFKLPNGKILEGPTVSDKVRVAAIKVFKDCTMGKYVEQHITSTHKGPGIFLPEILPDPAKVTYQKEGNA